MRIPPLNPLRSFEVAARHLNFTDAAAELNVTQGAVSRQVKVLESYLNVSLFERTPDGVELSPAGRTYASALGEVFERIALATDELLATQARTTLVIRGYTTFIVRWLVPLLSDFQIKHPHVEVRLVSADEPVDFEREAIDLGIRYGNGRWNKLRSDRLFTDALTPVCSPKLLEKINLRTPDDLAKVTLLHLNQRRSDWSDWLKKAGCKALKPADNRYFNDLAVVFQCALDGIGVAMAQTAYVQDDLKSGRLVAPFDLTLHRDSGYYLVCPRERSETMKIAAFRTWLLDTIDTFGMNRDAK